MSSEQQPELRWAPIPPSPKNHRRVWLIAGLAIVAVMIVALLLWFVLLRGGAPSSEPTPRPSSSATTTPTPTPTPTPQPTTEETAEPTPQTTAPPVGDPDLATFGGIVKPRLDDATAAFGFLPSLSSADATPVVDQLQQDAERLASSVAPSSISASWSDAVLTYAQRLTTLRSAYEDGSSPNAALDDAAAALADLRALAGV